MDNLLTLVFEAHNSERNNHRQYAISIGQDLFEKYTLAIRYGRPGQSGQERLYASIKQTTIRKLIRERLVRRLSAPKRIGCSYRLTVFDATMGFDSFDWLPNELMKQFAGSVMFRGINYADTPDTPTFSERSEEMPESPG
jgi:predicted DNA-binding WGR domain protein